MRTVYVSYAPESTAVSTFPKTGILPISFDGMTREEVYQELEKHYGYPIKIYTYDKRDIIESIVIL